GRQGPRDRPRRPLRERDPLAAARGVRACRRPRDAEHRLVPAAATVADRIAVGRINSPWGLKGHGKVTPLTSNPDRLAEGSRVLVRGERRRILEHTEPYGYPMLLLEGYTNRNAAERLRGELLEIEESELPPLPEGEYYIDDLVGLTVVTVEGAEVGELAE